MFLGLGADAQALKFVPKPPDPAWLTFSETDNADDPALPVAERLARLTRTVEAIESVSADIREYNTAIDPATAEGDALEKKLTAELAQLDKAANSATVRAATGAVEQHGLGWLCNHMRNLGPEFETQSKAIATAVAPFEGRLAAIPIDDANAAARIGAIAGELNANLRARLAGKSLQDAKAQLDLIAEELPFAWGTYTTLSRMADEADADARSLSDAATTLQSAARMAYPYSRYTDWKNAFLAASHTLQSTRGVDLAALKALFGRVNAATPLPNGADVGKRVEDATARATQFRTTFEDAYRRIDDRMRAMRREYNGGVEQRGEPEPGADAGPDGCGGMKDAVAEFRDIRTKGGKTLRGGLDGLSKAAADRDARVTGQIKKAANAATLESNTLAALDKKLALWATELRSATTMQKQVTLKMAIEKANAIKAASAQNKARMEKAIVSLGQESSAIEHLKQTIEALGAQAEASIGS